MSNDEFGFLASIYETFIQTKNDETRKFLWKLNAITKTMNFANKKSDDEFCENALRMIMVLFHNYIIDDSEIEGRSNCDSNFDNKQVILPILIEEFT